MQIDLSNPLFHAFGVPICSIIIGVCVNLLGLREGDDAPKKNCLAIGSTIFLMLIGISLGDIRQHILNPTVVESCASWFWIIIVLLFGSLVNDKYFSWEEASENSYQKRTVVGILIPTLMACITMFLYQLDRLGII